MIFTEKTLEKKIGNTTFVINSYENGRKTLREIVRESIRREIELNLKKKIK